MRSASCASSSNVGGFFRLAEPLSILLIRYDNWDCCVKITKQIVCYCFKFYMKSCFATYSRGSRRYNRGDWGGWLYCRTKTTYILWSIMFYSRPVYWAVRGQFQHLPGIRSRIYIIIISPRLLQFPLLIYAFPTVSFKLRKI